MSAASLCAICGKETEYIFSASLLNKYEGRYFLCSGCGYLRIYEPYWLAEAYSSAIADADTGLVLRNIMIASKLSSLLFWVLGERGQGRYLDSAGGYGMLTRLMRDYGFDFYWSDKYCANILARGFEYDDSLGVCNAATSIEVFEHVVDPVAYVDEVLKNAHTDTLIFTTELYEGIPPKPEEWWYYSLRTGQHIGFFQHRTLIELGNRLGLNFYSANGIHVLTKRRVSKLKLKIATNPFFSGAASFVLRRFVKSKTIEDHKKMLGSI